MQNIGKRVILQNGYKLITNKKCLDKYLVEINKNLNHFNKNIECEILLIKETLCSDKHFIQYYVIIKLQNHLVLKINQRKSSKFYTYST